ncbi:MAG TPA: PHP domain-containing protein [Lachnospiraceae bacterium]|nr:PHP domain-containing protein [Lachnospiraceae bacterium]
MKKLRKDKTHPYVYETHLHTSQGSACAYSDGKEMANACKKAGYTGIIVTDHFFYGNCNINRKLPWKIWVEEFCKGYEDAKKQGDKIGLQVFFGWEAGYNGTEFLIYGLNKEWLINHPEIKDASVEEQFSLVHEGGGIVIHAHPFREESYIPEIRLFPKYVDGVEGVNSKHSCITSLSHNNPLFDELAKEYAKKYHLPMTAGSDIHDTDLLCGGMAFSRKLVDSNDFIKAILDRENYILLDGNESL